jgi:hypothetical protein
VQKGDIFALATTIIFCGLGLILQTFSKRYLRLSGAVMIAIGILCLGGWGYYRADAQSPSTTGNCSPNGDHNTYNGNDCRSFNTPPRKPNGIYQDDQFLGTVGRIQMSADQKKVTLTHLSISGNSINPNGNFELQDSFISCPAIAQNMHGATHSVFSTDGDIICDIVGWR